MENKIKEIKEKIKILIEIANSNFNGEWNHSHELRLARIDGMLEVLEVLTNTIIMMKGCTKENRDIIVRSCGKYENRYVVWR